MVSSRRRMVRRIAAPAAALTALAVAPAMASAAVDDLHVSLTGPAVVSANVEGVWRATVTNFGDTDVPVSEITVNVPTIDRFALTPDAGSPDVLAPGDTVGYTFSYRLTTNFCGKSAGLYMTVRASRPTVDDANPADDAKTLRSDIAACRTDLAIAKVSGQASYVPGRDVVWTVTVANRGATAVRTEDVRVSDPALPTLAPVDTPADGWLDPGESLVLRGSAPATAAQCGTVTNTATVTLAGGSGLTDDDSSNDSATADAAVAGGACTPAVAPPVVTPGPGVEGVVSACPRPVLGVELTSGSARAGGPAATIATLRNRSRAVTARDVVLRYTAPRGTSFGRLPSTARLEGGVLVVRLGSLAPGRVRDVRIALQVGREAVGRASQRVRVAARCGAVASASGVVRFLPLAVPMAPSVTG